MRCAQKAKNRCCHSNNFGVWSRNGCCCWQMRRQKTPPIINPIIKQRRRSRESCIIFARCRTFASPVCFCMRMVILIDGDEFVVLSITFVNQSRLRLCSGVICYFDDTLLRDFVFLDPPWLCSLLRGILAYTAHHQRRPDSSYAGSPNIAAVGGFPSSPPLHSSQVHQNSIVESVELYTAMKQAIRQHLMVISLHNISSSQFIHFRFFHPSCRCVRPPHQANNPPNMRRQ